MGVPMWSPSGARGGGLPDGAGPALRALTRDDVAAWRALRLEMVGAGAHRLRRRCRGDPGQDGRGRRRPDRRPAGPVRLWGLRARSARHGRGLPPAIRQGRPYRGGLGSLCRARASAAGGGAAASGHGERACGGHSGCAADRGRRGQRRVRWPCTVRLGSRSGAASPGRCAGRAGTTISSTSPATSGRGEAGEGGQAARPVADRPARGHHRARRTFIAHRFAQRAGVLIAVGGRRGARLSRRRSSPESAGRFGRGPSGSA